MKSYSSYKDSGIEWIGDIPDKWELSKLKYTGDYLNGYPFKPSQWGEIGKPIIRIQNLTKSSKSKNRFSGELEDRYLVKTGDLLFSWSTTLGIFEWKEEDGWLNQHIFKVLPKNNIDKRFFFYLFEPIIEYLKSRVHGSTMTHLTKDNFSNNYHPLPPLIEQSQIVSFLDNKTQKIDDLIQKTEKKIELLKEKRTSLINHCVTKGLNPNVEMKDSSVEWIGEIPSHWDLLRLNVLGSFSKGKGITKDKIKSNGYPCIRCGEIYTTYDRITSELVSFINEETTHESVFVSKRTIFFTGDGETLEEIGKSLVYDGDEDICVGGGINVFKPKDTINHIFLSYVLNSEYVVFQKSRQGKGEIVVHIYSKQLKNIRLSTPPLEEQIQIVEYLDEKTQKIDSTIEKETKRIELLKEYRRSLISEVVTGKIKVVD